MAVEDLTKGNDDGTNFGQSASDKIGFYGLTTPIVQDAFDNAVQGDGRKGMVRTEYKV